MLNKKFNICVIGLGYVGLPLAVELSRFFPTNGYDISSRRVKELSGGLDRYNLIKKKILKKSKNLKFYDNPKY